MRTINLAYLVSQYPAYSHTFILHEINALRKLGLNIHVASINTAPEGLEEYEQKQTFYVKEQGPLYALLALIVAAITSPIKFLRGFLYALWLGGTDPKRSLYHLFYLTEASILKLWMKKHSLKHIHIHFSNPAATVALILSKIDNITFSMTVHGPDEFDDVTLHTLNEKICNSQFVICISNYAQSQLMRLVDARQWSKLKVIRLGVDTNTFLPEKKEEDANRLKILCVGRLVHSKGQLILIDAIKDLLKTGRNVHLTLVGDGPDKSAIESLIKQHGLEKIITLTGALEQNKLLSLYKANDIFVLPSFAEGIPVVLMEAMSSEIPSISTWVGGIPELITQGTDGLLVAPSNVQGLAQTIEQLIDDPVLRLRLGKNGREKVLNLYKLEKNVKQLRAVFEDFAKQ